MGFFDKIKSAFGGDDATVPVEHVYTYPDFKQPLAQAYNGRFEACYIILTQFYILDDDTPDDEILDKIKLVPWRDVIAATGIPDVATLNHALLTHPKFVGWTPPLPDALDLLSDIDDEFGGEFDDDYYPEPRERDNPQASGALRNYTASVEHFERPNAGVFDEYYFQKYINMFKSLGHDEVVVVPTNPQDECVDLELDVGQLKRLQANSSDYQALQKTTILASFDNMLAVSASDNFGFPDTGTVISPDLKFLLTVDFDSHFALAFGDRQTLETLMRDNDVEGFFATPKTMQEWWNPKNN